MIEVYGITILDIWKKKGKSDINPCQVYSQHHYSGTAPSSIIIVNRGLPHRNVGGNVSSLFGPRSSSSVGWYQTEPFASTLFFAGVRVGEATSSHPGPGTSANCINPRGSRSFLPLQISSDLFLTRARTTIMNLDILT